MFYSLILKLSWSLQVRGIHRNPPPPQGYAAGYDPPGYAAGYDPPGYAAGYDPPSPGYAAGFDRYGISKRDQN